MRIRELFETQLNELERGGQQGVVMRYRELVNEAKADSPAATALIKNGWRKIGSGVYATVFEHPAKKHVMKLFNSADTAYLEFVEFAKQHRNKHFPRFGKLAALDGEYAVNIERLSPITADRVKETKLIISVIALLRYRSYEDIVRMAQDEEGLSHWQEFVAYLEKRPAMKDAIFALTPLFKKHFCDLCDSNFMLRGDLIVFSDPVETISSRT